MREFRQDEAPRVNLLSHHEYWDALGELPGAVAALVAEDDDTRYRAYWVKRTKGDPAAPALVGRLEHLRHIIADIRAHGYDPDRWRATDPRPLAWEHGTGPLLVTRSGSRVFPRDGSHRACILRALGLPVEALVWKSRP
ncbi:MAG: hypothetical protein KIS74_03105 [Burkholderiales bacterium]|nr:hypothetical protein [Burkholderiales bacterium]